MRIYVASKFENAVEVREAFRRLRTLGHEITHDWTDEKAGDLKGVALEEFLSECALKDMYGVKTADAILVINYVGGKGMFVEMGMAVAWGIPGFFVFPERLNNIFVHLHDVEAHDSIESAVQAIQELAETFE